MDFWSTINLSILFSYSIPKFIFGSWEMVNLSLTCSRSYLKIEKYSKCQVDFSLARHAHNFIKHLACHFMESISCDTSLNLKNKKEHFVFFHKSLSLNFESSNLVKIWVSYNASKLVSQGWLHAHHASQTRARTRQAKSNFCLKFSTSFLHQVIINLKNSRPYDVLYYESSWKAPQASKTHEGISSGLSIKSASQIFGKNHAHVADFAQIQF